MSYDAGRHFGGEGWIGLNKNENQFVPHDFFDAAFRTCASRRPSRYPDSASSLLKRRIADLHGVDPGNIHVGNGSDGVLSDLLLALRKHHSQAHLPEIGYKIYDLLADRHRFGSSRYRQPGQGLAPAPGVWLIDSPNAITGGVVDRDRLERMASCDGAFVVWDNCYGDFECERLTMPDLTRMAVVRSFSKYYGLAGLRVGYCIADRALVAEIERGKDIYNVNAMALAAAAHALDKADEFRRFGQRMLDTRNRLAAELARMGFDVCEPHGNFVFVHHHDCHAEVLRAELEQRQIGVRRFDYPEIRDWLRITVPNEADFELLVDSLDQSLAQHRRLRETRSCAR